jgi:hypothetical protein
MIAEDGSAAHLVMVMTHPVPQEATNRMLAVSSR